MTLGTTATSFSATSVRPRERTRGHGRGHDRLAPDSDGERADVDLERAVDARYVAITCTLRRGGRWVRRRWTIEDDSRVPRRRSRSP